MQDTRRDFDALAAAEAILTIDGLSGKFIDAALSSIDVTGVKGNNTSRCKALLTASGIRSQGEFAAVVIQLTHMNGLTLTPEALTRCLASAFPGAAIGKRHGPHYMSLARSGNLKGLAGKVALPHAKRQSAPKPKVADKGKDDTKKAADPKVTEVIVKTVGKAKGKKPAVGAKKGAARKAS